MSSSVDVAINANDTFNHIRIVNGIGVGLCFSRFLLFCAEFIQHPKKHKISLIHFGWLFFSFTMVIAYWWSILNESSNSLYGPPLYIVSLLNIFCLYFIIVILTPEDIDEYGGYERYFISRRLWVFSFIILFIILNDVYEVINRNDDYYAPTYIIFNDILLFIIIRIKNKYIHISLLFLLNIIYIVDLIFNQ
ncbi:MULTISPECIES: hypothetical protein [Brucella]|uniref:Uncharacterized protein n=2 Tax=Brucella pinnipedialis TaxID=120576 RepID=A0A0E1WZM1_9HYPH|nr:hypothetical protein [Brucella ceti]AEK53356.1 hypothetical protein BPI_I31 [Brucella pinnipedialis B2/94]AIJ75034.1 putative membrane protein [Brucella pinnipedialis]EEY27126.1 conserved hypothetical protein [Brucella sp. F5/99]EEZ07679.1 conserved hypothetical protein [Brucella ceti M490/95/1]EEZ30218.1 conserved hypothetical protein [Brucella pinnipedialis M292/94/1]ENR13691.1 hypothetical protein C066_01990 [Brucella sp. UK5/01]ENT03764.1 hypothetical protein B989_00331 [Brucella sp. 